MERWSAELTNHKLRRSAHRSVTELETDIRKWITEWNKNPRPFVWAKTAGEILESLTTYCQRSSIQDTRPTPGKAKEIRILRPPKRLPGKRDARYCSVDQARVAPLTWTGKC